MDFGQIRIHFFKDGKVSTFDDSRLNYFPYPKEKPVNE